MWAAWVVKLGQFFFYPFKQIFKLNANSTRLQQDVLYSAILLTSTFSISFKRGEKYALFGGKIVLFCLQ